MSLVGSCGGLDFVHKGSRWGLLETRGSRCGPIQVMTRSTRFFVVDLEGSETLSLLGSPWP